MRRRFWQFVHDKLEQAWHWVYYNKLAGDTTVNHYDQYGNRTYTFVYGSNAAPAIDFEPKEDK